MRTTPHCSGQHSVVINIGGAASFVETWVLFDKAKERMLMKDNSI